MPDHYLLIHEDGKVTARRAKMNKQTKHWEIFGQVELYDLPIPEIRMAVDVQKVVEKYRSDR